MAKIIIGRWEVGRGPPESRPFGHKKCLDVLNLTTRNPYKKMVHFLDKSGLFGRFGMVQCTPAPSPTIMGLP